MHYDTDGKKHIHWWTVGSFVVTAYAVMIALAELFWYEFAGGFSALIGGYAAVFATLVVIRVVGASLANPYVPPGVGAGAQ
jgi:hypothetical protein